MSTRPARAMAAAAAARASRSSCWAVSSTALASLKATLAMMSSMVSLALMSVPPRFMVRVGRLLGERETQLRVAGQPEPTAEAQHCRLGRACCRGQLADGQAGGAARVGEDDVGDTVLGGRQRGLDPPQADEQRRARGT